MRVSKVVSLLPCHLGGEKSMSPPSGQFSAPPWDSQTSSPGTFPGCLGLSGSWPAMVLMTRTQHLRSQLLRLGYRALLSAMTLLHISDPKLRAIVMGIKS